MGKTNIQHILDNQIADVELRIFSHCYTDGECLRFPYSHNASGYGQISVNRHTYRTHRLVYQLHHRIILTPDQYVCHTCDIRDCCNVNHLFVGSAADNMADKIVKGRQRVARGEQSGPSKLTEAEVTQMIVDFRNGVPCKELSYKYKVSLANVYEIAKYRNTWKHIII